MFKSEKNVSVFCYYEGMRYKAVGFDYGGVIGGINSTGERFDEKVCNLLSISKETYDTTYYQLNHKINLGDIDSRAEFWKIFLEALGKSEKLDELLVLENESTKYHQTIDLDMVDLIDKIHRLGYKTGLFSNTTLEGGNNMRKQGLDKHFDAFQISAEIKIMKPNPDGFKYFANQLGVELKELIFVDDAEKSLSTAKECGFTPILFTTKEKLIQQLCSLGILD